MKKATLMWIPLLAAASVSLASCGNNNRAAEIRQWTDDMAFRISVVPAPPIAEEMTVFKIVVSDNGRGFDTAAAEGHGLKNIPGRLARMGGQCSVESRAGTGTRVAIHIPIAGSTTN